MVWNTQSRGLLARAAERDNEMAPDLSLKHIDFSKQVSVRLDRFNNFPSAAVTFCFWIRFDRQSFDTTNLPLISHNDVSRSDHPNSGGPQFTIADPSNLSFWIPGTRMSTGVSVDDGDWHHVAVILQQDVSRLAVDFEPREDSWERFRRLNYRWGDPSSSIQAEGWDQKTVITTVIDGRQRAQLVSDGYGALALNSDCPFAVTFPYFEFQQREGGEEGRRRSSRLADRYMAGLGSIAEIRVWDGARTLKQIAVEMTGFLGTQPPKLRLHWRIGFAGGLETTMRDASGSGNDGRLVSSIDTPRWVDDPIPWRSAPMDLSGVDLSGAEIKGLSLQGRDLTGADLGSAQLDNVDLTSANLSNADMRRASLSGTGLTGANLRGVNFDSTVLTGARFSPQPDWSRDPAKRTILTNATVSVAILGRNWSYLHLTGASVAGLEGDLSGRDADSGINASNIIFRSAPMSGCRFQYARFDGADLTAAFLNDAELAHCSMVGTILYDANLSGATLSYASMNSAKLGGAGASQAEDSARLSYAFMPGVVLTNAELYGVDLSYAQIYAGAKVDSAHLEDADLSNANLCGMDLTQAHMKGVNLTGATLVNCNFNGVDLSPSEGNKPSSLTGAHLQGADFTATNLNGVNLSGAGIALAAGTISVKRNDEKGAEIAVDETYKATVIAIGQGDKSTIWPDRSRGVLRDTAQLEIPEPPKPTCIPSLTQFCPRPKKKPGTHR